MGAVLAKPREEVPPVRHDRDDRRAEVQVRDKGVPLVAVGQLRVPLRCEVELERELPVLPPRLGRGGRRMSGSGRLTMTHRLVLVHPCRRTVNSWTCHPPPASDHPDGSDIVLRHSAFIFAVRPTLKRQGAPWLSQATMTSSFPNETSPRVTAGRSAFGMAS